MLRFTFLLWLVLLQPPAPQGRGNAPVTAPAARATVLGTTIAADSSQLLPNVALRLVPLGNASAPPSPGPTSSQTGRGGAANPAALYQTTSDAAGNFVFQGIAPGRYSISADCEGYQHFQSGPGQTNNLIVTVTAGGRTEGVVVAMAINPAISGTILSPYGERLAGVSVYAYRIVYTPNGRRVKLAASTLTHEGGEYRLYRLEPGYYYVAASYSDHALQPWRAELEISPNLSPPDEGFSTIYFPSETRLADARAVSLFNGAAHNIDIGLRVSNYFKLSVKVILPVPPSPMGPFLLNTRVALFPVGTNLGSIQDYVIRGSGASFRIDRLAAGDYVLAAVADVRDSGNATYTAIVSETLPIQVRDDTDVSIAAMYPFDVGGSVLRTSGLGNFDGVRAQLVRIDSLADQTFEANVDASGRFTFFNVGPGNYDLFVKGLANNVVLQSTRIGATDRPLQPIAIDDSKPARSWRGCPDGCRLVADGTIIATTSNAAGTISGRVVDSHGEPATGAIVFVPGDAGMRLRTDHYFVTYTDADGVFQQQAIPTGSYTAFAFERIEKDIYYDPEFNRQLATFGRSLTVTGGTRSLDQPLTVISQDELLRVLH